jgi:hypothetical protein
MGSLNIIPEEWKLPAAIRTRISPKSYGRQRAIFEEDLLLVVLHGPPDADGNRDGVLFFRDRKGDWQSSRRTSGGIRQHIQQYGELATKYGAEFESVSDLRALFDLVDKLTPLVRASRNMHHALQTARENLPDDPFLIEMRDYSYEVERDFELLLDDVRNAIQFRMVRDTEAQAKFARQAASASHRLTILAALFFPLTALGSMFGMNVQSGIEGAGPLGFWGLLSLGVGFGIGTAFWVLSPSSKA